MTGLFVASSSEAHARPRDLANDLERLTYLHLAYLCVSCESGRYRLPCDRFVLHLTCHVQTIDSTTDVSWVHVPPRRTHFGPEKHIPKNADFRVMPYMRVSCESGRYKCQVIDSFFA